MDAGSLADEAVRGLGAAAPAEPRAAERGSLSIPFEAFYADTFPKVYAFIRCHVSSVEIAQDLVSRIFTKAYQHRHNVPSRAPTEWVFRIAHTTLIDYWRVERRRESASVSIDEILLRPTKGLNPEAAYARKQQAAHLFRVMAELSEDDRLALTLKFNGQQTNREIARILDLSERAVSMRLLRALRRLRDRLEAIGWR